MSIELLSQVNNRYHMAILFHREQADLFWYLSLPGFAMMHEYQLAAESFIQRKIKRFIISTYNRVSPDDIPKTANIITPLIKGKSRKETNSSERWTAIKESFKAYETWEDATLREYERIAKQLSERGEIASYRFVSKVVEDVHTELSYISDLLLAYNSMDYDMPQIVSDQDTLFERYEYKMKKMHKHFKMYHHYNSAVDAESKAVQLYD